MADPRLDDWKKAIDDGGSVLLPDKGGGRVLATRHDQLPTEADLARGDPEKERLAAEAIDAQIAALQAARAGIGKAAAPGPVTPPHPEPAPPHPAAVPAGVAAVKHAPGAERK